MALSIPSVPFILPPPPPAGICHFVLEKLQMPHGRTWDPNKNLTIWGLKRCANAPPQDNTKIIGHFRVPKTLTSKMRLGAQPFLWKRVLFAWESKMISISKAEHLPSYWNTGQGELRNGLLLHFWHQNGALFSRRLQLILICVKGVHSASVWKWKFFTSLPGLFACPVGDEALRFFQELGQCVYWFLKAVKEW